MDIEMMLNLVKRPDDERMILGFTNGFAVAFEKKNGNYTSELLQWYGGSLSNFSEGMKTVIEGYHMPSVGRWRVIESGMKRVYHAMLDPLGIQRYGVRSIESLLKAVSGCLSFYARTGITKWHGKPVLNVPKALVKFALSPDNMYKVTQKYVLARKPSAECAAFHTNGKMGVFLDHFNTLTISFPDRLFVIVRDLGIEPEYFLAACGGEDWYSHAKYFLPVQRSLRKELGHLVAQKEQLAEEWCVFKREVEKKDFTSLLEGLGFL